jgi:adenylyl-sulfate kinase
MDCSPNVSWHNTAVSRARRAEALEASGATIWLTGLPASGKSTIGAALEQRLIQRGIWSYLLDGDNLRHGLCADLGFGAADRDANVRRVGELALLFADCGVIAIAALVSPFAAARAAVRERHRRAAVPFLEVFVDTPLQLCADRDPKGLYARARNDDLHGLTGIDAPYERPGRPDLILTPDQPLADSVEKVLAALAANTRGVADTTLRRKGAVG